MLDNALQHLYFCVTILGMSLDFSKHEVLVWMWIFILVFSLLNWFHAFSKPLFVSWSVVMTPFGNWCTQLSKIDGFNLVAVQWKRKDFVQICDPVSPFLWPSIFNRYNNLLRLLMGRKYGIWDATHHYESRMLSEAPKSIRKRHHFYVRVLSFLF